MKKNGKIVDVYKPNSNVTVTVTNKALENPDTGEVTYKRSVSIRIAAGESTEKLAFPEDDSIAKYVETVDFQDPQTELPV